MSYSRKTLAAFSEALGALYAAKTPAAALRKARPSFTKREAYLASLLQPHVAAATQAGHPRRRVREAGGVADFFRLRTLGLTPRECEVAFWVSQGKRDAEVAVLLGCAVKTVSKHVENLLAKTGAETRAGATHAVQEWLRGNAPAPGKPS